MTQYGTVSYTYNGSGMRTSKTVNGQRTEYFLSGDRIVAQKRGGERIDFYYGANGITGFAIDNNFYTYRKNAQGDITHILDTTTNLNNDVRCHY